MQVKLQTVLKRELKNRKLTINGLAKSCGIAPSIVHAWVHGVLPSAKNLHHIYKLAEQLNLPISVLLFDFDETKQKSKVIFSSHFSEGDSEFKILVEKTNKK